LSTVSPPPPVPSLQIPLYAFVWRTTRKLQIRICFLTALLSPLALVPLELQRRIIDNVTTARDVRVLIELGLAYLAALIALGAFKYALNIQRGKALETAGRDLRRRILMRVNTPAQQTEGRATEIDAGKVVSMLASESEDVAGFAADAFSLPLLQGGTILFVLGYLIWLNPIIAVLALVIYFPQAVIVPKTQNIINRWTVIVRRSLRLMGLLAVQSSENATADPQHPPGSDLIDRVYAVRMKIYARKYLLTALGNFLDALGPIVVLVIGGWLVIDGKTEVSTLFVLISGFQRVSDPWDQIVTFYRTISNSEVLYRMIGDTIE
jgi:ABC-type bacteriocin/lantibiotic exporter with double-glycine peptidase domain